MDSAVYAPISGIISETPISAGSTVGTNSVITVISVMESLEIIARIPEREIAGLVTGLKAEVSLQAYPGETLPATVKRVSPEIDSHSRTKQINLKLDQNDSRINAGMYTRLRIITNTYPDVLTVPSEAIINNRGVAMVCVIRTDNNGQLVAEKREVSSGVTLQGWTEIRSGLAENEMVIVQGQQLLSGGEAIRIISTVAEGAK
jgi:RND family efflux transporter MFP subunit